MKAVKEKCRSSGEETFYTSPCRHPLSYIKLQSRAAGLFGILITYQSVGILFVGSSVSPVANVSHRNVY
jgi:hypothetical protein